MLIFQVEEHKKKDPAIIAVFKDAGDAAFKAYELAAGGLWSDYDFGHTFDASLIGEVSARPLYSAQLCSARLTKSGDSLRLNSSVMQAKDVPALIVFKTYDEPTVVFDGKFDGAAIKAFIEDKTAPVLVEMDQ